eukprot:TRINITY_DN59411_c0_g1_i1.p1 TRINITY_DN59411_c0_g1~~TRINITY_DN59411_c0_g1_i1.p1  ORF type:complete len:498 (-),score=64.71 TRINITY_DN59411_c0_g1_i1:13-1506(-)
MVIRRGCRGLVVVATLCILQPTGADDDDEGRCYAQAGGSSFSAWRCPKEQSKEACLRDKSPDDYESCGEQCWCAGHCCWTTASRPEDSDEADCDEDDQWSCCARSDASSSASWACNQHATRQDCLEAGVANVNGCASRCCWKGPSEDDEDDEDDVADVEAVAGASCSPEESQDWWDREWVCWTGDTFRQFALFVLLPCTCCCVGVAIFLRRFGQWRSSGALMMDAADAEAGLSSDSELELPSGARCPPHWSNKNVYGSFDERLECDKMIVSTVQDMINKTWKSVPTRDRKGKIPERLEVVNVQRIEDSSMWVSYLEHKDSIRRERGGRCKTVNELDGVAEKGHVVTDPFAARLAGGPFELDKNLNEHYFFHGTSPEGAYGISDSGFKISLAGSSTGTMFGRGAYFAERSSKADEYATTNSGIYHGIYALLISRVCCGEMFRVTRSDIPAIEQALKTGNYDSVLGDREAKVGTYREFVVFRQKQIYPEYVVLYKRVMD